jgi:hypothetical protein
VGPGGLHASGSGGNLQQQGLVGVAAIMKQQAALTAALAGSMAAGGNAPSKRSKWDAAGPK